METKQISFDHNFPPLSTRHHCFIAQNLESDTQIVYTIDNMQYSYECQINELDGRRIRACFHGWVILSNHPDSVLWSLWNPLTSKLIHLPPLINEDKHYHQCCLSAPPGDQGSVFLLTTTKVPTIVLCRLNCSRNWIEISYAEQLRSISCVDDCFLECPTCCNGEIYAMTLGRDYMYVIQVDIVVNGKELGISLMPFVEIPYMFYHRCPDDSYFHNIDIFLKGSCKDLFCIGVCFTDETVIDNLYLFKLDITSMMWEEMVDLKDAIFFIELASDYSTCYYGSVVNSEVGGYVHILGGSGKIIYTYHAKDRSMSISSTPCVVQESQASAWAMLEWRLEIDQAESKQEEEDKDTQIVVRPVKGDETEFDNTTGESHVLNIPIDILKMIMELCIGSEYMRFRATCKHCYLEAPPILQWSSKTTLRRLQMCSLGSPLLMVLDNYRGIITFIDPTRDDRYFIKIPQELEGYYQIYYSKYGWVLMYQINGPMVLFNPFTGNIRELPVWPYLQSFCFSAPPTSSDCMVVGFTDKGQCNVFFHFVSREPIWRKFRLNFGADSSYSYRFPTFNGRDVYALCNNKGLDVFKDMAKDDYSWEVVVDEALISGCKSPPQYFLSNCDQHSLLVIVGEFGESVEVFKATESSEEWEKIDGLGKHMIYITNTSCICLDAKSPEMENKIYFPRLLDNESMKIVFYSLETCMYHTFDGKNIQESFGADLFGTEHHCCPHTWIEPSWS